LKDPPSKNRVRQRERNDVLGAIEKELAFVVNGRILERRDSGDRYGKKKITRKEERKYHC